MNWSFMSLIVPLLAVGLVGWFVYLISKKD